MPTVDPNVCTVQDAERLKFTTDSSGEICIRTCLVDSTVSIGSVDVFGEHNTTLPTLTNGQTDNLQLDDRGRLITSATAAGLSTAGKITEIAINSTGWTALPTTALSNRNGIGIQNPNGVEIKINFDNSEPSYVGWRISPNGETFLDIKDSVIIYARAAAGTPTLTLMEVA